MTLLLATASLAALVPSQHHVSRRGAILGAGAAALPGAAMARTGFLTPPGSETTGKNMVLQAFGGKTPEEGFVPWLDTHLAPDFTITFTDAGVTLDKKAYMAASADLVKSFPDVTFNVKGNTMQYAGSPFDVEWVAVVKGTLSGEPFSPLPGVPAVAAKSPPVACTNDPEKITARISGTIIKSMQVEPIEGAFLSAREGLIEPKGFSGPVGFYLQAGGDPKKLPKK